MTQNIPLLNFAWITEGLVAVGDEPSSDEKMNWLLMQGFQAVVSLGQRSNSVTDQIMKSRIGFYFYNITDEKKDSSDSGIMKFMATHFLCQAPVYIFSSVGIEFASGIAKEFMAHKDLHIVNYLSLRADDLNHGDEHDWIRGHEAFHGNNIYQAINALIIALSNDSSKIQLLAADTLIELMEHTDHGCFPKAAVKALTSVRVEVQNIVFKYNPEYRNTYEKTFQHFDELSRGYNPGSQDNI
jgi:hypothetical protein